MSTFIHQNSSVANTIYFHWYTYSIFNKAIMIGRSHHISHLTTNGCIEAISFVPFFAGSAVTDAQ